MPQDLEIKLPPGATLLGTPVKLPPGARLLAPNVIDRERERRNEAARQLQAAKYPTAAEAGVEPGPRPFSFVTAGKTMLSDLVSPLALLKKREGQPYQRGPVMRTLYNLASDLGQSREHSETEAGRAWAEGDYPAAITRGIANMIPVVGPMIANIGEEAGRDPGAGVGHVAAAVAGPRAYGGAARAARAPIATTKAVLKTPAAAYRAGRAAVVDATMKVKGIEPYMSVFNAIKPRNFIKNADKRIESAMPEINRGAEITGKPTVDVFSFGDNLNAALRERMTQRRQIDAANPIEVDGAPIAKAIIDSVPKLNRVSNPAAYEAIKTWARETWNKKFDANDIVDMLEDANASASVQGYYQKLPGQQIALNHRLDMSMANAQAGAMRKLLMTEFDKFSGTGTARGQVNMALRDLITVKDLYDRRYNVELRQAVQSLPQQVSKLLAVGKFGKAGAHLAAGNVGMATIEAATGMSEVAIGNFLRELNSTNGQIASAFRRFNGLPRPLTVNPVNRYNMALGPASSRVEPQSMTGAATPGSTSAQTSWRQQAAQELPQQDASALPRDMQTDWRETFARFRGDPREGAPSAVESMRLRDLGKFIEQERGRGQLGLQTTRPAAQNAPDFIDVPFRATSGGPIAGQPSSLPETRQIGVGSGQMPGRPAIPSPLTTRDLVEPAKSEIVRDPKTGRFKKVYTSEAARKLDRQRGAVPITANELAAGGGKVEDFAPLPRSKGAYFITSGGQWVSGNKIGHLDQLYKTLPEFKGKKAVGQKEYNTLSDSEINIRLGEESEDLANSLRTHKLIRIASMTDDGIDLSIVGKPTSAAVAELKKAIKERPDATINWDFDEYEDSGSGTAREFLRALGAYSKTAR